MLKVLVVDDDQALRFSVRSALENAKRFSVEEAFDGVNALEKIKANKDLKEIGLLKQSRLSVIPITEIEFKILSEE